MNTRPFQEWYLIYAPLADQLDALAKRLLAPGFDINSMSRKEIGRPLLEAIACLHTLEAPILKFSVAGKAPKGSEWRLHSDQYVGHLMALHHMLFREHGCVGLINLNSDHLGGEVIAAFKAMYQ